MEDIKSIVIGVIGSIIASVVLYGLSRLYIIGYKKKFTASLFMAKAACNQICNMHRYVDDYSLVMDQIDVLFRCVMDMYESLCPLSLFGKSENKRLIVTMLYDIMCGCSRVKNMIKGYSGDDEYAARLRELHKCFYKSRILDDNNMSTVSSQLDLIEELLQRKSFYESIERIHKSELSIYKVEFLESVKQEFIEINSFKNKVGLGRNCYLINNGLCNDEYDKIIDKIICKYAKLT